MQRRFFCWDYLENEFCVLEPDFISTNEPLRIAEGSRRTIFEAGKNLRSYKQFKELTEWICDEWGLEK